MAVDRSRLPDIGPDSNFRFPAIVRHRLQNGVDLRTVEHPGIPIISMALLVEGGVGADPPSREGLAAITADMVDEGTGSLSAIDVSDALARLGAEYDVDVGADAVMFSLTTLTRFARQGASLLSRIVATPSLRAADFDRVRQLRLDRLRQLKDLPPAVAERVFLRLMYGDHPYGHLAIGTSSALQELQLEDVQQFHASKYQPSQATLVMAGAMSHAELADVAEAAFGGWAQSDRGANAAALPLPSARHTRLAMVPREGAAQSELRIGLLAAQRNTPDYFALLVMNAVLGGQFVSRINLKLREEKGFTYGARTGFDWRRGPSPFALQASVHTVATSEAVRDSLAELEAMRGSRPPTEPEMALAKASLTRGYPRNFETVQQVARSVSQLALYGLPDSYFEAFTPRVNAIGPEEVTAAAHAHLDVSLATTLIVGDHAAIADSVAGLELGDAQIVDGEA